MFLKEEPSVKAMFVLDSDGNRISSKYFDKASFGSKADQSAIEKKVFTKTKNMAARVEAEVIVVDNIICVFRQGTDGIFYVLGASDENELILAAVLECFYGAVNGLLRGQTDKMTLFDNLELLLLATDEIVDSGVILELDSQNVMNRVLMRGAESDVPLGELTISQAIQSAKQQWTKSFFRG